MKLAVAYYRVSSVGQGRSGLGLDAQELSVKQYCEMNDLTLIDEILEVKSTRKRRIGLEKALAFCKANKAILIVARLDRLGRDVEEIAKLVKSEIEIIVADNPHANRFTIHILAAVAEEQRRLISLNTKEALQAAKRRGIELGKNGKLLSKKNKEDALNFALKMKPVIKQISEEGFTSMSKIASELNSRQIPTFRSGCSWHVKSVYNVLARLRMHIQSSSDRC